MIDRSWGILLAAVLVMAAAEAGLQPHLINHDVAQFLYGGRALLSGATLYRDFIEMNLPTTYLASTLPVLVAQGLGLNMAAALQLSVLVAVAASVALSALILNRAPLQRRPELLLLVLVGELLPAFHHFGQREHLFVILAFPYVLSFLMVGRVVPVAIAAGVLAGLGLSLKPYFFILPLFIEAAMWRRWWGHVQSWFALGVGGTVMAAALWRHPEYITDLLPLARATYGGWEAPPLLLISIDGLSSSVLAFWLAARIPDNAGRGQARLLAGAATAAGIAIAVMQNKGYDYHMLPAVVPASLLLLAVLLDWTDASHVDARRARMWPAIVLAALLLSWNGARFLRDAAVPFDYHDTNRKLAPIVAEWGGGHPIAGLSVHVFPTFPYLMRYGGEWALRYPSLWPLVGYFKAGGTAPPSADLVTLRSIVTEDMETKAPCLVFVDTWDWGFVRHPFVEFLSGDPRFAALWKNYRLVDGIDGYDIYSRCGSSRHIP